MPKAPAQYTFFTEAHKRMPHWLRAFLPGWSPEPDPRELVAKLEALDSWEAADFEELAPQSDEVWRVRCGTYEIALDRSEALDQLHFTGSGLSSEEVDAMQASELSLAIQTTLGENILEDFHASLRVLDTIAPAAIAMHDVPACVVRPAAWVHAAATSLVPPPPTSLFTVHAVADPNAETAWLHTHGLMRCGSIDLELLAVPREDAGLMCSTLLNVAAALFIEEGVPEASTSFSVGKGLELIWLPWEQALRSAPELEAGGPEDRNEDHEHPSGVLFVPPAKRFGFLKGAPRNPSEYLPILNDNPLLYHSSMETRRMSMLAKEHFPVLRKLVNRYVDEEDWGFLAKLGYAVDDDDNTEHLWFEVHGIDKGEIDATLINEPYAIARMKAGQRAKHAPDLLSDWAVYSPHGRFEPDHVHELLAKLEEKDADS